ncbi:uncharacterized protein LOC131881420 isoform X2 [Tigriopus californicus]|uniref:uncharacterized protein LOC131881420 isoform X2 n=1 Tax=Tigriopus californicus TaxID=6832 RepID=UPI0027DA5100|nr:uncharacterized protein LOC131881420 isoform X2 [Tigriopus californicus]
MIPYLIASGLTLVFGTLYPAYASYKAVRTKNVREYVKWMMYWIVFAFFTTFESMADLFIAFWFPFYYELKIIFLLWLISPVSRGSLGSSMLYRKLIHPNLMKREDEIDRMIGKLQEQGYNTAIRFGSQAFQYVTNLVMTTAIRGGGGIVSQLKKSYSLTDLSNMDEADYDQHGKSRDPANRSYPRAIGYHGQPEDDPYFSRERSESRGSGSRSRDNPYEPMFYSESPMRHHTRRQISETHGDAASSGYSSGAEFLPVQDELMHTDDYELYDPRLHSIRYRTPTSTRPYVPSQSAPLGPSNVALRNRPRPKKPQEDTFSDGENYYEATSRLSNQINQQIFQQPQSRPLSRSSSISDSYYPSEAETDCTDLADPNDEEDEDDEDEVWVEPFEDPVITGQLTFLVGPQAPGQKTPIGDDETQGTLKKKDELDGERTPIGGDRMADLAQIQDLERVALRLRETMEQAPPPVPMKFSHSSASPSTRREPFIEERPLPSVAMGRETRSRTGSISSQSGSNTSSRPQSRGERIQRKQRAPQPPSGDPGWVIHPRPPPLSYPQPAASNYDAEQEKLIRPVAPKMTYPDQTRPKLRDVELQGPITSTPVPFSFPRMSTRTEEPQFREEAAALYPIQEKSSPMPIGYRPTSPRNMPGAPAIQGTLSPNLDQSESASGLSVSPSKCPHCTIHSWLPHSSNCAKWKGGVRRRP